MPRSATASAIATCEAAARRAEGSLAKRLEHVLGPCPNVTARIVGDQGVSAFVRSVRDTRNYYTHWDPGRKRKAVTEARDLYRLTLQLAVLETVFLLELDFECERIEGVLERARRFDEIDTQRFDQPRTSGATSTSSRRTIRTSS